MQRLRRMLLVLALTAKILAYAINGALAWSWLSSRLTRRRSQ